jgi:hypothetical protein
MHRNIEVAAVRTAPGRYNHTIASLEVRRADLMPVPKVRAKPKKKA